MRTGKRDYDVMVNEVAELGALWQVKHVIPEFNSIGVKLARKAKVPVIPLALKTDAWGEGKLFKDHGKIDSTKRVHFAFGGPLEIQGQGGQEQQQIIDFITGHLQAWRRV